MRTTTRAIWVTQALGKTLFGIWGESGRASILGLIDQSIVSAARFATTLTIGRFCGAEELGIYALAYSLMLTALNVQDSLIMAPFIVYTNQQKDSRKSNYAGSVLFAALLLAGIGCVVLGALAWGMQGASPALAKTITILAVAMPFVFLHQFGRRFAFAEFDLRTAILLDFVCAALQLGGLAMLALSGGLSAGAACAVVGAACAIPALVWFYCRQRSFAADRQGIFNDLRRNWQLGRWMLGSLLMDTLGMLFSSWFLAGFVGVSAAGVYAACLSIACLTNPILLGLNNVLKPRVVRAFSKGGYIELRRVSWEAILLLQTMVWVVVLPLVLFSKEVLTLLYGAEYSLHYHLVALLALSMVFNAASIAADQGLLAVERTDWVFGSQIVGVGTMCLGGVLLIPFFGVIGAAWAALTGSVLRAAFAIICHEIFTRPALATRRTT